MAGKRAVLNDFRMALFCGRRSSKYSRCWAIIDCFWSKYDICIKYRGGKYMPTLTNIPDWETFADHLHSSLGYTDVTLAMILVAVIRCFIRFIAGKPEPGQLHSQKCSKPNNNVPNIVTR